MALVFVFISLTHTKRKLNFSHEQKSKLVENEYQMHRFLSTLRLAVTQEKEHKEVYQTIADAVCSITNASGSAIYLKSEADQMLEPAFITENCAPLTESPYDSYKAKVNSKNTNILEKTLSDNTPKLITDLSVYSSNAVTPLEKLRTSNSAMIAPLTYLGKKIGVLAVTRDTNQPTFTNDNLLVFHSITEQSAFAIGTFGNHSQLAEKNRLEREIRTAQEVQRVLIPKTSPKITGFDIYGKNIPAQMVSGDYFDYHQVCPTQTGIVIADVSGKGVPAGITMATFRSTLKTLSTSSESPAQSLSLLNKLIYSDVREDMFISAVYCHFSQDSNLVKVARAGHNPPYHYKKSSDTLHKLKPPGLAVGIDKGNLFDKVLKEIELTMDSGDFLFLYTDGIIEAINTEHSEYGTEKLEAILLKHANSNAKIIGSEILDDIASFVGNARQSDDITLVVIKKL